MNTQQLEPIGNAFSPVSTDEIAKIETLLGVKLPKDYKTFISIYGRCGFAGEACIVVNSKRFPIFTFYGSDTDSGSLLNQLELHPDLCDIGAIPIADDLFNNIYVYDTEQGGISLLDYSSGKAVAHKVATSFQELFERIEVKEF